MSVRLVDLVNIMTFKNDKIKVFDIEDNLIFQGMKSEIIETFKTNQILATKKITTFFSSEDILIINVKS